MRAVALATALSSCQAFGFLSSDSDKLHRQAQAALARWADAVAASGVVVVGDPTGQLGDWEEAVGDNNKRALYAGLVEAGAGIPGDVPSPGVVRWPDGRTATVPLISAQQALADIRAGATAPCSDCRPMQITGALLADGPIQTGSGPATGPRWEFTVRGTAVKVTRVAIANRVNVVPPPANADGPPIGLVIDSATATVAGRELTVAFTGAPRTGDQPCGVDYTAEGVESTLAVVVIVTSHPNVIAGPCTAVGAERTATATLAAPLGDRAVLEVQQGLPVPVRLTP